MLWPWNVDDPGLRREAAIAPTLAQIIIVIIGIFDQKEREKVHIFVPKLLYCASNHAFQAFLAKEQFIHQLTEGPPLHKREKGCEFELTPLKRVFPKQSMEPWVIYFCFGQEGTPTLSTPTP